MAKEFHLFPRLPLKLREMIWKNAIRSNQPGVHVFTIYDHVVEVDTESLHSENHPIGISNCRPPPPIPASRTVEYAAGALLADSFKIKSPSLTRNWTDEGLMTACRESHVIIKMAWRRISTDKGIPISLRYSTTDATSCPDITIFPREDLIVFQPTGLSALPYGFPTNAFTQRTGEELWNIAVDFNTEWVHQLEHPHGLEELWRQTHRFSDYI